MKNIKYTVSKPVCRTIGSTIRFLSLLIMTGGTQVEANVGNNMSFRWRPNPLDDNIIGYRLYYGGSSRFNENGSLKPDFSYSYYIDLAELERCVPGDNGTNCKFLGTEDIQCENLYGEFPSCSISNLHGHLYFALTAYNAQAESGFTPELKATANPRGLAAVQNTVMALLLQQNRKR